jgi:hypothetical protein
MNFEMLLLIVIAILCLIFGLGTTLHQGLAEGFVRKRFRGKLWQRLLGCKERAIIVIRRVVGPLMLIIGIWAGANANLLTMGGG